MWKALKNIVIGFAVSAIGSIPLGYLNLIGFQIYIQTNTEQLFYYLLGVLVVEAIVIWGTLQLAERLTLNPKWKSRINLFSAFFLFFMAYYFYSSDVKIAEDTNIKNGLFHFPVFVTGLFLSAFNFAQIPFWLSWNLLLTNGNYIVTEKLWKGLYLIGTLLGTFSGMLCFILGVQKVATYNALNLSTILSLLPFVFLLLAIFQLIQWYRKLKNREIPL